MGKIRILLLICCSILLLSRCGKNDDDSSKNTADKKNHSVLIYMASNNSLYSYSTSNLQSLEQNYSASDYKNGNIVVYQRGYGAQTNAQLLLIDNNQKASVIKTYPIHNSADTAIFREVIDDFKRLFPAESYGCILWSHASAWLPQTFFGDAEGMARSISTTTTYDNDISNHPLAHLIRQVEQPIATKAFGQDGSDWMEINEIAATIKDNEFEYIIADACYMASIEVAYELKDKAKWLLAAPTEVLANGMEYNTMGKNLLASTDTKNKLLNVATDFEDKYAELSVALINLLEVENFANEYKKAMSDVIDLVGTATPRNTQRYDRYSDHVLFDLIDYVSTVAPEDSAAIDELLKKVVVYKYATSSFLGINMQNFSGISTYIKFENYALINPFYEELGWWKDVLSKD